MVRVNDSSSSQQPLHSMLAAVIGLATLGTETPTKSSPSSSECSVSSKIPSAEDAKADAIRFFAQAQVMENSLFTDNTRVKPPQALALTTTMLPHNQSYPASAREIAQASSLKTSLAWPSTIHQTPTQTSFAVLREQQLLNEQQLLDPKFAIPFQDSAMAMGGYSVNDRIAAVATAMDRPAAVAPDHMAHRSFHSYHNNSNGASFPSIPNDEPQVIAPIPIPKNFPETLYDIISAEENQHIISWLPHGQGFILHDKQRFASKILPRFFDGAKFASFTRRLNRWSFARFPRGPEMGAYSNPNFIRNRPELVQKMRYRKDGNFEDGKTKTSNDQDEQKLEAEDKVKEKAESKIQETKTQQAIQKQLPVKKRPLDIQERPMPLPKRPRKAADVTSKINRITASSMQGAANESFLSMGHPNLVSPVTPGEIQLMEIQRKLLLESVLSNEAASGRSANGLGPSSTSMFMDNIGIVKLNRLQSMIGGQCGKAQHVLKAECMMGCPSQLASNNFRNQKFITPKITAPSKIHNGTMDAAVCNLKSRLTAPSCIQTPVGFSMKLRRDQRTRPIMTQEEGLGVAQYLFMQRNGRLLQH